LSRPKPRRVAVPIEEEEEEEEEEEDVKTYGGKVVKSHAILTRR